MLTVYCPLCRDLPAERTLDDYTIMVKGDNETLLGGLCVFRCPGGHVFFVREADLGTSSINVVAA